MGNKVVKFGGSSLADVTQFKKVADIITSDEKRVFVVPSAPGKRNGEDTKVTDMLYALHQKASKGGDYTGLFADITKRFTEIIEGLNIDYNIAPEMDIILENLKKGAGADYVASRGEYLCGKVLAHYIGYEFIDPKDVILFKENGEFDGEKTDEVLSARLKSAKKAVIPGFFGSMPDGKIKTFSRGGSDITGSIVARAARADMYENWTDVSGFLMCDPKIVSNAKTIDTLTYRELRELAYMGATVLHEDSIFPVRQAGIPINVRNTNDPLANGTMIVSRADEDSHKELITGIAGHKGFLCIHIEKDMMNGIIGYCRRLLSILERHCVSIEHMPTGIDTVSLVVPKNQVNGNLDKIIEDIKQECQPDMIDVEDDMALIATVGHGMQNKIGMAARIFTALSYRNINIRLIDQGSSELNIIIGIQEQDFEEAVRAIYHACVSR